MNKVKASAAPKKAKIVSPQGFLRGALSDVSNHVANAEVTKVSCGGDEVPFINAPEICKKDRKATAKGDNAPKAGADSANSAIAEKPVWAGRRLHINPRDIPSSMEMRMAAYKK